MKNECIARLTAVGINFEDAVALRRIAMTLHAWHEGECGTDNGGIERDEATNKTYWVNSTSMMRSRINDRETGALTRLKNIILNYPDYVAYVQGDPRGASLYIVKKTDIPDGKPVDQYYTRGIAVYK